MRVPGRFAAGAMAAAVAMGAVSAAAPAVTLGTGCSVRNGPKTFTNLATAIKVARPGATLVVRGTCTGSFTIGKRLTLRSGRPSGVLKGKGGSVLRITDGPVTVQGLKITGGRANGCGNITNAVCGGGLLIGAPTNGVLPPAPTTLVVKLDRVTITGNNATGTVARPAVNGAGIFQFQGTLTITSSTIAGNKATSVGGYAQGGGIETRAGTLVIRRSLIAGNQALGGDGGSGGGIDGFATITIEDSTISGNQTTETGGGLSIFDIPSQSGPLRISGSTITKNTAGNETGGLLTWAALEIDSTIVAGNTAGANPDCWVDTLTDATNTLIGVNDGCGAIVDGDSGNLAGSGAIPRNPKLADLAANGGPTRTHALKAGSPAIDAAGAAPCSTPKDQRGVARPKGPACDIGAFERS